MARAKAARKFHAARTRQVRRLLGRLGSATITLSIDMRAFGCSMAQAAAAMSAFAQAQRMARQGFKRPAIDGHSVRLEPGQLFARQPDGQLQHLGATGPIRLRLGHDPLPGQVLGCTCTFTRMTKTDSHGQPHQVDVRSPPCDWCLDLEDRAAGEGFGLVPIECCATCGEVIEADVMMGTTCACARRADPT